MILRVIRFLYAAMRPIKYKKEYKRRKNEKRTLALLLALAMVFALSACRVSSSSSSSTTITTSVTDADGNTTEKTVTNEIGVSAGTDGVQVTNETTTSESAPAEEPAGDEPAAEATGTMADLYPPMEDWYDRFAWGAEGEADNGEQVYFAVDDPDDMSYAMLLFRESDGSVMVRDGKVDWGDEEGVMELYDADVDKYVPFTLTGGDEESVVMTFLVDDSTFVMYGVDQDTIIRDIYDILSRSTLVSDDAQAGE